MPSEIISNPHTHTNHVDGKSTAREQIEKALELGFVSLGFTEHAQEEFCGLAEDDVENYINEIRSLAEEYCGRLKIWLGIERDRLSTDDRREAYDYILGANHGYLSDEHIYASVDGEPDELVKYVDRYFGGSWDKAIEVYFDEYACYIEQIKPDIIAHIDLIVKYNRKYHWFDEGENSTLVREGKKAMERMIKVCDVLEVNTGGMARSNQPCPYPVQPLLKYWHELGGRVIPSSDCHRSWQMYSAFDIVGDYMKQAGFTTALRLGTKDTLFEEYEL